MKNTNFWFEKYKPLNIKDIIGQDTIKYSLLQCLKDKNLPHLLFHGSSGIGKSLIIHLFIKEYYGKYDSDMILFLNSRNERGIKIVRDKINTFSKKTIPLFYKNKGINHKLVVLEDAETITGDAQTSLRRCIETNSHITRFCIICNNILRIIDPIVSRCCTFHFNIIQDNIIHQKLIYICRQEKIPIDDFIISNLVKYSLGDLRKAINSLQSYYHLQKNTLYSEDVIFKKDNYLLDFIHISKQDRHKKTYEFNKYIISKGINLKNFILYVNDYVIENNIPNKCFLIEHINHIYNRIMAGSEQIIQLMFLSYLFLVKKE